MEPSSLDAWRFRLLGASLLALLLGHAALGRSEGTDVLMAVIGLVFIGALLWSVVPRHVSVVPVLLAAPIGYAVLFLEESAFSAAGSWYHIPLLLAAAWAVAQRVMHAERADEDVVVGSICVYLLVAIAFAAVFDGLERAVPGAFRGIGEEASFNRFLYVSFVTITTVGYGDVTAVLPGAQSLVCLESVLGILYPAIVVARIVELATTGQSRPFAPPPSTRELLGGRYRLLALLLILALLATPWIQASPAGGLGLAVLLFAQLLGTLYATGARGLVAGAAWVAGAAALLGAFWPGGPDSVAATIGLMGRVVFFLLATGSLVRWLARERNVTQEVLFASLAGYLMLGLSLTSAFRLLETLAPGSISFPDGATSSMPQIVYFAFMTLTTTGFGEITPATPVAESMASLGALIGIFYPAVLLARLVSLYGSEADDE